MPPLGIQLYTVREALAADFEGVVRRIAGMGYAGVEFAGDYGESPASAAKLVSELGMQVASMHAKTPMMENLTLAIDAAGILGTTRVVCPWTPPENFATVDGIKASCEDLNKANQILRGNNLQLLYHNHWAECYRVGDKFVYQHMLDYLEPEVGFEFDVYWAQSAGLDPAAVARELGKRAPLLHIKDGPATSELEANMTAVGEGNVDMSAISKATAGTADWWLVELDRCATDMLEAVEKSYNYITAKGFAHGR